MGAQHAERFAMVGFCWGAWIVFKASASAILASSVTCGVSFHPSVHNQERAFGGDDIQLCASVKVPQLVHATNDEPKEWKSGGEAENALRMNPDVGDAKLRFVTHAWHGFMIQSCTRPDSEMSAEYERGLALAVDFIDQFGA